MEGEEGGCVCAWGVGVGWGGSSLIKQLRPTRSKVTAFKSSGKETMGRRETTNVSVHPALRDTRGKGGSCDPYRKWSGQGATHSCIEIIADKDRQPRPHCDAQWHQRRRRLNRLRWADHCGPALGLGAPA